MEKKKNKKKKPYVMPQDQLTRTTGWLGTIFLASVAAADALMLGRVTQNSMSAVSLATQIQFIQNMN